MKPKPNRLISRAAMMLLTVLMAFVGAQTAWAQFGKTTYPFKPTITYDGVNASDVTFSLTGGGVTDQALSNGQNFNVSIDPSIPTSFTITCSNPNGLDLQVNYSGKVYYMLYYQSNITFTTNDCYGSTFNVYHNDLAEGNQYIAVTITVMANTSHDVNLPTGLTGGSITSNKSNPVTTAETVTLTAVPGSGYLPTSISATRHNGGAAVGVDWDGSFDNTATFAMPNDAVDVSASFTNVWTAAGGLVAKIPKNNATRSVTIPSGVTSFKVYGPSGSSAKTSYVNLEQGKLLLTAPDGCIIKLTGDILAGGAFLIDIYDGNSTSSAKIGSYFGDPSGNEALPDNVVSTGNTMLITTMSYMNGLSAGLDLTAVVINTSAASTVTIIPAQEGGTVTADKTPAEYSFGETVTLSVTPDAGYLLGAISVTDESGNAVNVVGSSFTNSLTFTMPATNVTVTPTFTTTWTADGGLFANMPATGSATVTIPNGVASFNVYDDGGQNRVVSPNCNGILTQTASDGCKIRLTGDIYSGPGDVLSVYDGANISGTVLLNEFYPAFSYGSIGTHVSTGESMTLKFVTDAHENRDGLRLISTVLYPVNVASSIEHGTVTADKDHAAAGETVTLDHHREGYVFLGYTATGVTLSGSATSFTMPANDVTIGAEWADPADISVNAAGTEYTIHTAEGWGIFCYLLAENDKGIFSGKTVVLGNDITVTRMAGGSGQEFTGTFNGNGKTLTVDYANTDNNVRTAPFSYVDGATIQNLIVGGTISGTAHRAAGIIGETGNTTSHITNCVSNVDISSGRYTGGFSIGGNVEIEGCVFNGKINGTDKSGGFIGYSNSAQVIKNSLFAPQDGSNISGGTFYYNGGSDVAPVNSYCTQALGTAQGKQAHSITTSGNATLAHAGVATEYSVSGITAYKSGDDFTSGILYDNVLYAGSGDAVSLTLANTRDDEPLGYRYTYAFSGGTADEYEYSADYGETSYHLTMPDQDVTVNVDTETLRSTGQAVSVSYVDPGGQPASHDAIALDGTETTLGQNNQETWYYVGADISYGAEIDCYGNVNIILADGKTMTVSSGSYGIYGDDGSLTIYGQTLGTGTLNATATATNGIGIYTDGIVTINGGTVNATGTSDVGIRGIDGVTINGGTVTTTGIMADGDVTISGGKFTATDDPGISSNSGNVILGWTSADDFIRADSYSGVTVKIADGQSLHNGSEVLSGIINDMNKLDEETLIGVDVLQDAATNDITALATRLGGKQTNVVLQDRKLYKDGAWNTLCLPFDLGDTDASKDHWFDGTPLEGATVMTLANSPSSGTGFDTTTGTLTLYFIDADRIEAGVPYIIRWGTPDNPVSGIISNPVFQGVTIDNDLNDVNFTGGSFKGTYNKLEYTTENKSILFLGEGNTLYYPQPSGNDIPTIGAFRAYFDLGGAAGVRQFVLNFDGEGTQNGIGHTEITEITEKAGAWYSLDGVRLDGKPTKRSAEGRLLPTGRKKGLYIHGGKKVVVP